MTTASPSMTFDQEDVVARIERLSRAELDALPFGVIKLDASGSVTFYSRTEARQSGYGERPAVGKDFFTELAPCMATAEFLDRVKRAHAKRTLDIRFEHVGDFDDATRVLRVRIKAATDGGTWILLQR